MRKFYLRSMDPSEEVRVVSAPKQIYRGGGAYGSQAGINVPSAPTQLTLTEGTV